MKETIKQRCAACCNTSTALKACTACKSVWYCNRTCQLADRKAHRSMCKKTIEKAIQNTTEDDVDVPGDVQSARVSTDADSSRNVGVIDSSGPFGTSAVTTAMPASISQDEDDDLFAPPPPREDCPVCMVTLPLLNEEAIYMGCCGKLICSGCISESRRVLIENNANRIAKELPPLNECCPFCRTEFHFTHAEYIDRLKKRMDHNDPRTFYIMAEYNRFGREGIDPDMTKAFALTQRAADLGLSEALYDLGICYGNGAGVARDRVKERHYFELAAKRGDVEARHNLGCMDEENGNMTLACKHWVMAASSGNIGSLKEVKRGFCMGIVSKEDYASTLRAHQKTRDEQWSKEREKHKRTTIGRDGLRRTS